MLQIIWEPLVNIAGGFFVFLRIFDGLFLKYTERPDKGFEFFRI